jgi:hypothetical protein
MTVGLAPAGRALDTWLDRRFEAAMPVAPVLAATAALGLDIHGLEALLRAGRAAYPPAERRGAIGFCPLPCDHVDHETGYAAYLPAAYDPAVAWPLVVIGHGGAATRDLAFGLVAARAGMGPWCDAAEQFGLILLAPLSDRGWGAIGNSILFSAISRATRAWHIDPDRIHVTGHSMGGHLAWRCGINFADRWGAVAPMSGGYDFVASGDVENLTSVPGYATWGTHEPFGIREANRTLQEWTEARGLPWVHRECAGGHEIFPAEVPRVAAFLHAHPRDLYRTDVRARAGGPLAFLTADAHPEWGRTHTWRPGRPIPVDTFHWLRLAPLPPDSPPGQAVQVVSARYEGNAFEIASVNARRIRLYLHPRMVEFSRPVRVRVNGAELFRGPVEPDPATMLELVREFDDRGRIFHAVIDITVPAPLWRGSLPA